MTNSGKAVLSLLTAQSGSERRQMMEREVRAALAKNQRGQILGHLWKAITISKTSQADLRRLEFHEWATGQVGRWLDLDATDEFLAAAAGKHPYALYLRAYAAEGFEEIIDDQKPEIRLARSVEIGNVGRVFDNRMPVYGLRNALDFNLLAKYRPVWLPPQVRDRWQGIVREAAELSRLIIINATRSGAGFSLELQTIPKLFPDKTWLLAGCSENEKSFVSSDVKDAARILGSREDHVSIAYLSGNGIEYAEPQFPDWVRKIVIEAATTAGRNVSN